MFHRIRDHHIHQKTHHIKSTIFILILILILTSFSTLFQLSRQNLNPEIFLVYKEEEKSD